MEMSSVHQEEDRRIEAGSQPHKNEISVSMWRSVAVNGRRGALAEMQNK